MSRDGSPLMSCFNNCQRTIPHSFMHWPLIPWSIHLETAWSSASRILPVPQMGLVPLSFSKRRLLSAARFWSTINSWQGSSSSSCSIGNRLHGGSMLPQFTSCNRTWCAFGVANLALEVKVGSTYSTDYAAYCIQFQLCCCHGAWQAIHRHLQVCHQVCVQIKVTSVMTGRRGIRCSRPKPLQLVHGSSHVLLPEQWDNTRTSAQICGFISGLSFSHVEVSIVMGVPQ